jgi:mannosylglycerate hydrolase MGH1-like protein
MAEPTRVGRRLAEDASREKDWKRWGTYLSERQWGTVREDYSPYGTAWDSFPHDHARSRAYRWGEDGLLGFTDRQGRACLALALWNGRDPILKERLFGLSGPQGNHGEDVKECYFYLDGTPTHCYAKALYKYPQAEFPYTRLVEENRRRGRAAPEFELVDTGVFEGDRYFDITVEYAKASPDDILARFTVENRGPEDAALCLLPQIWFSNTWSWGRTGEGYWAKGSLTADGERVVVVRHPGLVPMRLTFGDGPDGQPPELLFTENETNFARLFGTPNPTPYVKDAFHEYVVHGRAEAVNPAREGTKAAGLYRVQVPARGSLVIEVRLCAEKEAGAEPFGAGFAATFEEHRKDADEFYDARWSGAMSAEERRVARQAYAGLLWNKQFYHYTVREWLEGDPAQPPPPPERRSVRNTDWRLLSARDVLSMPDKWEYPWFAAWDLAFHMIPFAEVDPGYAKEQLILLLREWYMHPDGQIPAYEWAFSDVNPPVHAWAAWRVYKMTGPRGRRDRLFLERVFQKQLLNFTWWVNRKDAEGDNVFGGGFLGLDNIGAFDRSQALPYGARLEQADATAWMAFYCGIMLSMALELASEDRAYEDLASKFFEHFVAIADAINTLGGHGLWDEDDGFYYDQIHVDDRHLPLKLRSLVGAIPLFACQNMEQQTIDRLPGFRKRMQWFLDNRSDLSHHISYMEGHGSGHVHRLLAIPTRERLVRVLAYLLDEEEFLSPYGVRSLSKRYLSQPYRIRLDDHDYEVQYDPAESTAGLFGGNSNWRGPVWFPLNYLLIEALECYDHFYGASLTVEFPTGSGHPMSLRQVALELSGRLTKLFLPDSAGRRPCHGDDPRYATDPAWKDLALFYEFFHGDTGRGLGASHQTGWTALVTRSLRDVARERAHRASAPLVGTPGVGS